MADQDRGFRKLNREEHKDIASKGGQSQGKHNNPANFANDPDTASQASESSDTY
jgi:general stress protein YciG